MTLNSVYTKNLTPPFLQIKPQILEDVGATFRNLKFRHFLFLSFINAL